MNITTEKNGNAAVIRLEGWLDAQSASAFNAALDALEPEITELELDLQKLEYISSAGLRVIVIADKKMQGGLTVTNASVEILDVFRMTGFDKKLNIK
ncbi:MAG: STAS domain-containing protein [Oscillospiraceae bacterium]|nr:STAS domain-containing protein [Oscillospiraceae bacterium]